MNTEQMTILAIRQNPKNRLFFEASTVFGDRGYRIISNKGGMLFEVKTSKGKAHYVLDGTEIGNYTIIGDNA